MLVAAPHRAPVLQHQHVAEARVAAQVAQAIAVGLEQPHHLRGGKIGPGLGHAPGVSVTSSCAPIAFIRSNIPAPRRASCPSMRSRGCLSGVTRMRQPVAVLDAGDLDRIQVLVARAERAGPGRLDARVPPRRGEDRRSGRGDDHPAPEDGIASELGHAVCGRPPRAAPGVALSAFAHACAPAADSR